MATAALKTTKAKAQAQTEATAPPPKAEAEIIPLPVAPAPKPDAIKIVSFDKLILDKNNPRQTYDEAAIKELAENIRVRGVLQNLVVTTAPGGRFNVKAGQRRYLACQLLVKDGAWKADEARIPVKIESFFDDADALLAQIIENNQREEINPMEEAAAFLRLHTIDAKKYSAANIGRRIGRSTRYVEIRLALPRKLIPETQKALSDGKISLRQAQAITLTATKEEQKNLLDEVLDDWGGPKTAAEIREYVLAHKPAMNLAAFDAALYTGEIIPPEPEDGKDACARAADRALFEKLQREALLAKAATIRNAGGKVELLGSGWKDSKGYFYSSDWGKAPKGKPGTTVIVLDRDMEYKIHEGLLRKSAGGEGRASAAVATSGGKKAGDKPQGPEFQKTLLRESRRIKSLALQRAVADSQDVAMRLVVAALLGAEIAAMGAKERSNEDCVTAPEVTATAGEILAGLGLKGGPKASANRAVRADHPFSQTDRYMSDDAEAALWTKLRKLKGAKLETLFRALVAARAGDFNGFHGELGDTPVALLLAEDLKVDMKKQPGDIVTDEWLAACRKPQLVELIVDAKIDEDCRPLHGYVNNTPDDIAALKTKELLDVIKKARKAGRFKGYVPRALRFGTAAELTKAKPAAMKGL